MLFLADIGSKISPTLTSLLFQRRQFGLNCKRNIAMKITYKIVALFTENYPSMDEWNPTGFKGLPSPMQSKNIYSKYTS